MRYRSNILTKVMGVVGLLFVVLYVSPASGQPPLTLTPFTPKVLKITAADPNDGASFTATPNSDGSLSFSLTSAGILTSTGQLGTRSETGFLKLTPPAGLTGVDRNTSVDFVPIADFSGSYNLVTNTNSGVTWQTVSDTYDCGEVNLAKEFFASAAGTPGAGFLCRLATMQVETVNRVRLAYFDANVTPHFDYLRDNPATHTVTTRFYFSLGPSTVSFRLSKFFEAAPGVPDCTDWPVRTYFFCNSQYDQPTVSTGFNFEHSTVAAHFTFSPNDLKGTIKLVLRESLYGRPDRTTLLMNYEIGDAASVTPGAQFGSSERELHNLYPDTGVYRWTFEATLTTASGQVVKDTKTYDVASIYIPIKDVQGFTAQNLGSDSIPDSLCAKVYYNNTFDRDLYLLPHLQYGHDPNRPDPKDPTKDQILAPAHKLEASGTRLCHAIDSTLLTPEKSGFLQISFSDGIFPYIYGARLFFVVPHVKLPPGPSRTQAGKVTLDTIFNDVARETDAKPSDEPVSGISDIFPLAPLVTPEDLFDGPGQAPPRQQSFGLSAMNRLKAARQWVSFPRGKQASAAPATTVRPQDVIGINDSIQFNPPIPDDGSFLADFTYSYDPQDFPDDPNFSESELQLVSFDPATGLLETYPTVVDTVNQTATARIIKLAPYYSLAVIGPFPGVVLSTPLTGKVFSPGLSLVNPGKDAAQLTSTGYPVRASAAPAQLSLAAGQQISSIGTPLDDLLAQGFWLQTRSTQDSVRGVALFAGPGGATDALPLVANASSAWILTGIELDGSVSTDALLANTSNFDAQVVLQLRDATGTPLDTAARYIPAKGIFQEAVDSLFPNATPPFRGYIVLESTERLVAARVWTGGAALAAVNGQLPGAAVSGAHRYVVPFVAGGGTAARVNLVNPDTSDRNLTLRAQAQNGAAIGQAVSIRLAPGAQYWGDLGTVFPIPAGVITPASLIIDSSGGGVLGDVSFGEARYRLWSSIAISEPAPSLIVPLVSNQAQRPMVVAVLNAGAAAANVNLTVLGADGSAVGSARIAVPAGGLSYDLLTAKVPAAAGQNGGYLRLDSDQPVTALALIGTPTQATDIIAIPATASTGTVAPPVGGPATPLISVSPNSLTFGPIAVGQTPTTMKFTISNSGMADLHVSSITLSGSSSFTLFPAFAPVTVAAGKSVDITVQFAPTVAGASSSSLSITSDDPDPTHNPLTISLTGTANPATTGSGGCLPPPTNLVSWWTGDGNANDSTGGNNGSVQGGTTFAAGEVGQAFQFDGSTGYVTAGNPANLRLTSAITVEAWINLRVAPTLNNMEAVVTKWAQNFNDTADSDSYGLWVRQDSAAGLSLFGAIHQAGGSEPHVLGGTIPLNTWTHVAMTFDSTTGQFVAYVNGQAVNSLTSPGAIIATSRNVFIGREDSFIPRPFNGLIDEASVYGRALSASEIQAIYAAGSAGKCKGTTGGVTPSISVLPKSLTFGAVTLGQPPATMKLTISNTGQADLHVRSITPSGDPSFSLVPAFAPVMLAAGKSIDITVQFAPAVAGAASGSLSIASDDPDPTHNPLTVMLSGTANPATTGGGSGNIISLKLESGTYNTTAGTFSTAYDPKLTTFDTDNSSQNRVMGVSLPGETNPLLNNPGKAVNIPAGSYYTYYQNYSWQNDVRLTVGWSNGTTDVAYFHVNGYNNNTVWPYLAGSTNLSVTFIVTPQAVFKVHDNIPQPSGAANDILLLKITGGSGGPTPGGAAPSILVSTKSLSFSPVTLGQPPTTMKFTISNTGQADLHVNSITLSGSSSFSLVPAFAPLTIAAGKSSDITVQFAPSVAGAASGSLSITSDDPDPTHNPLMVTLSGTANPASTGGGVTTVQLSIDNGTYGQNVGVSQGTATAYFVNRLTPPSYPATLRTVQIFFSGVGNVLRPGDPVAILAGASTGGSNISGVSLARIASSVNATGQLNSYDVAPITIQSGDFVVGFLAANPPNYFIMAEDISSGSKQRSYLSTDGATFALTDTVPQLAGNFAIRAIVDLGTAGGPAGACVPSPPNLVSWWSGDGNANDSNGGNNGTLQGGATFAAGEVGQAFQFDGSTGYVTAGNPANLRLTSAITIEAWINLRVAPTLNNMEAVVTKWAQNFNDTADSDSYDLWVRQDSAAGLSLFGAIHQSGGSEPHVLGGTIPLNTWTHVAMTFDSTTGQFVAYVNGQAVNSLTSPGAIIATSRNVFIGREDSFIPRPFNGLIDEVAVYGRALTASEIQAINNAGSAGKCKGAAGSGGSGAGSGHIISLKMEPGTYNTTAPTFSSASGPDGRPLVWDTDNSTQNWVIGVSLPGETNPLLNSPGKAVSVALGSYYTYYNPYTWANDVRLTVGWSNGTTSVAYFHVAGFSDNTAWPRIAGAANLSVTFKVPAKAVCKVVGSNSQPGCTLANDVLLLGITASAGGG